jgi:hypothetical protein
MFFDACVAIDKGGYGGIGYGCGGLAWERAYTSSDKYMCQGDNSWPCDGMGSYYCPYWGCVSWATWQRAKYAVLHKGKAAPDCTCGTCNSINFTVFKPSKWTQGHVISIRIEGKGLDLWSLMHLKLVTVTHENSSYQIFHSFYEEMRNEFSSSPKAKNLFLSLVESIAQTLNVTSCYVVGRPTWETTGLGKQRRWVHFNETAFPKHRKGIWLLKTSIIGNYCVSCPEGQLSTSVKDLTCLGQKFYKDTAQETQ